ncbi:MAG TPA: hypothetical protein VH496_06870 [Mycobacterium sp.]|jgi:hypothetical protein
MDKPDTIIEVHRERVQDQTADIYNGGTYQQPLEITSPIRVTGTGTLNLGLDRVWFVLDSHARPWQESVGGSTRDPLRHFAIDLVLTDSKIVIESIAGIPLPARPPATITIPDGPRAGESKQIAFNEIPLFGRITLHDQLEVRQVDPTNAPLKQTVSLVFQPQDAPELIATPPPDPFVSHLFGQNADRRADGSIAFGGQDPRITWDMDYAEAFWITHSRAGQALVLEAKLQCQGLPDDEVRVNVLDGIAARLADGVRPVAAMLGEGGVADLLPTPLDVDPNAPTGTRALDVIVQRFEAGGAPNESIVVQLQTIDPLPPGEELPASVLAEKPDERAALATAGFVVLRQVRDSVKSKFTLNDADFVDGEPCKLARPKTVNIGGEERRLEAFEATIETPSGGDRGHILIEGKVSDHSWAYDFDATFTMTLEMDLDDIPRNPSDAERASDQTIPPGTLEDFDAQVAQAAKDKRNNDISTTEFEEIVKEANEAITKFPRTVGARPTLRPPPVVDPNFELTTAGKAALAAGVLVLIALISLPVTAPVVAAGGLGAVGALGYGGLIVLAVVEYITMYITIDWFGTAMGGSEVRDALTDRPDGLLLPTLGVPIDVLLNRQRLAVYFRQLPPRLPITCIKRDTAEDADQVIQLVGGPWPTDGKQYKISDNDGALLVESKELELFIDASIAGTEQLLHVAMSPLGRRFLRTNPNEGNVDNLDSLPECPPTP